jgi:hypothetical protein
MREATVLIMKKQIFFWSIISVGSFTHWFFAALLTTFFPKVVESFLPGYVFAFFCGVPTLVGEIPGAGNQGRATGRDATQVGN